jgi:hypothetical protein
MTTSIELSEPDAMTFAKDGALRIRAALDASDFRRLEEAVANLPPDQAGIRLYGIPALRPFLASPGAIWKVAASAPPPGRSEPSSSTRRLPPTGDFRGIRIERSWSPGG